MLNFDFFIRNPFNKVNWKTVYYKDINLSENKTIDVNVDKSNAILGFGFRWSVRQSHAGVMLEFGFFGYDISIEISDKRHWNRNTNQWYSGDEV